MYRNYGTAAAEMISMIGWKDHVSGAKAEFLRGGYPEFK